MNSGRKPSNAIISVERREYLKKKKLKRRVRKYIKSIQFIKKKTRVSNKIYFKPSKFHLHSVC